MIETITGYCPILEANVSIDVEYREIRMIGAPVQKKAVRNCCENFNAEANECTYCPIIFGNSPSMP